MNLLGVLREISSKDLEMIRKWRNAPDVRSNMYTQHIITEEEHQKWWCRISKDDSQVYFIFEYGGLGAGVVSFNQIDRENLQSFWAFYAAPDAPRGTGIKMEVLALDYAFNDLELHKLSCEVLAFNTPVINMHKKFGFQQEGIFRQQCLIEGKYIDVYRLGILSTEWKTKRPEMIARLQRYDRK